MATKSNPRPDNIPKRPRLSIDILIALRATDTHAPRIDDAPADCWLRDMKHWATWASEYCQRLDAVYVEHQAIAHDRRAEPGELADVGLMYGGQAAPMERCKICAYLYEQHEANRL